MDQYPAQHLNPKKSLNHTVKQGVDKRLPSLSKKHREMVKDVLGQNKNLKKFDNVYHFEDLGDLTNSRTQKAWNSASPKIKKIFKDNPENLTAEHKKQINSAFDKHFKKQSRFETVKTRIGPNITFSQEGPNAHENRQSFQEFDGGKLHNTVDTKHIADFARMYTLQQKPKNQRDFHQTMAMVGKEFGPTKPLKSGSVHPILGRDGKIPVFPIMNHYAGQMVQELGEDGDYINAFEQFNKFKSTFNPSNQPSSLPEFNYRKRGSIKEEVVPPKRPKKLKKTTKHFLKPIHQMFLTDK